MNAYARRIEQVLGAATEQQRLDGLSWYDNAQKFAATVAASTGYSVSQVSGVIAALSPQIEWERNKQIAQDYCHGRTVPDQTQANLRKAQRILDGEDPEIVLCSKWGYRKTLMFYRCIMGQWENVCIDRHAAYLATGVPHSNLRGSRYDRIAQAYRNVAKRNNLWPAQAQAIAWLTWRDS